MSFQGDVGGIGLADLLQSLARGRDGVLTLNAKGNLRSTLGIQDGQLHLLPDQDEDPELWRNRVRQAWVKDPDFRIDALRMTDIARAHRIETLFTLLDSEQVHFRFLPGPVPQKPAETPAISSAEPGTQRPGPRRDAVFCTPLSVEGLLLEYARLKDELASANIQFRLPDHAVVVPEGGAPQGNDLVRMFEELDGRSTLLEVSDRLAWPLRQLRNLASVALVNGLVRAPRPEELFDLALRESVDGNSARAAVRLRGWIELSPPGPIDEPQLGSLTNEWQANRLQAVLRDLPKAEARTLLRRLDVTQGLPLASAEYWTEFLKNHQGDRLAAVNLLFSQIRGSQDPHVPALKDILSVARAFQQEGSALRAAALWRVAAGRNPESIEQRLEIGLGLLAARLTDEGVPWVVDAAGTLIEQGKPELAVDPLRRVLELDATQREARRLLSRARTQVVQRTITKKNTLVTLAVIVSLSVGAVVTFQSSRETEQRIAEITSHMSEPHVALRMLDEAFPGEDMSSRVRELRATLLERCKSEDNAARTAWTDRYREAQLECTIGEERLGLARALELPAPPRLTAGEEPLPLVSDLYNGLSARLDNGLKALGEQVLDEVAQLQAEEKLVAQIAALRTVLEEKNASSVESREFGTRLGAIEKKVRERDTQRVAARTERLRKENLERQDMLLATARAHAQAGDYARSLEAYQKLVASDDTNKLAGLLKKEMDTVAEKGGAVANARALALAGKHDEALKVLEGGVDDPRAWPLPWRLETFPPGATARAKDGVPQKTPYQYETASGERFDVVVELAGFETQTVRVEGPRDHFVWLSRHSDAAWESGARVEALPAPFGDRTLVCDRAGNVALVGADGKVAWTKKLGSLGGIARTPLALPLGDELVLLVTEDGEAWTIALATGALEGPHALPAPPLEGPIATNDALVARLRDGSLAVWRSNVRPKITSARDLGPGHEDVERALTLAGSFGVRGANVLRRRTDAGTRLSSPDGRYTLVVDGANYLLQEQGKSTPLFAVQRRGEWSFVAWDDASPDAARPRVWIADDAGLRAFRP
ncbi:MAG: DUF4388 domain-containing protein [Planctomycetes bacterium]|nr:DUF4388 domain-containing protein [Planctomycetota bacterium]